MIKRTILVSALLLAGLTAVGAPVEQKRAAKVAHNFWAQVSSAKAPATLVDRSAEWAYGGIYLFTNPEGGFVLVAADDNAKPILGYSLTGTLDPSSMPPSLVTWLDGYQQQLDALSMLPEGSKSAYAADAAAWLQLEQGLLMPKDGDTAVVGPLLTCQWDQTSPYNVYCPQGTVTGCAATAQAQMMYYWQFPAFGVGAHTYTASSYGVQRADFGHTLLRWDAMTDKYGSASSQDAIDAVARLMYIVGVSLEMSYGTAASGGSSALGLVGVPGYYSIDNSLQDFFHYSRDMYVIAKQSGYTNDTWRAALIDEIDLGHPILYGGYAEQGGHGFVCDGYDSREYMHFNFGWSGVGDGYYPVDSISPGVGGAGGNVTYTFNDGNTALIGAVPLYAMRVSDTLFNLGAAGGRDSLLFSINDAVEASWNVSSDAAWLTLEEADFARSGWVMFNVDSMDAIGERMATITFTQGTESLTVKVVQVNYDPNTMCALTVVMESTRDGGWQNDACLTLESPSGYVFGTARLESGMRDSVEIMVIPSGVYVVWHSGGGTDRYINYYVRNSYGQTCVSAEYAYLTGGRHHVAAPCEMLAIDEAEQGAVRLYPNPVEGLLHVEAEGLSGVEVYDMCGRRLLTATQGLIDFGPLPQGVYMVRVATAQGSVVRKVVK